MSDSIPPWYDLPVGRWLFHLVFWLGIYALYLGQYYIFTVENTAGSYTFGERAFIIIIHLLPVVAVGYWVCYRIVPLVVEKRKLLRGCVELIVGVYSVAVLSRVSKIYVMEPLLSKQFGDKETIWEIITQGKTLVRYYVLTILSGALPFVVFQLLSGRLRTKRIEAMVQQEKQAAELAALKNQLNPHFLFNILNSIYSLAVLQSSQTAVAVARLSDMLDYLLYRCNERFVPLQGEIDQLNNYLALQQMRFGDRLVVKTSYSIDGPGLVAPLIILTIAENMFKHGVEKTSNRVELNIRLQATATQWELVTSNPYEEESGTRQGIGLANLRRQLTLLYPGRHHLLVDIREGRYILKMRIQNP